MPIKTTRNKKRTLLKASGSLTVEQAAEFLQHIQKAMKGPEKAIELDLSEVAEADISCLQLLCSAHKSSVAKKKILSIIKLSSEMGLAAADAGFHQHYDCGQDISSSCLWLTAEESGK